MTMVCNKVHCVHALKSWAKRVWNRSSILTFLLILLPSFPLKLAKTQRTRIIIILFSRRLVICWLFSNFTGYSNHTFIGSANVIKAIDTLLSPNSLTSLCDSIQCRFNQSNRFQLTHQVYQLQLLLTRS